MADKIQAKAIVTKGKNLVEDVVTLPALGSHEVLVRVQYAAFNPTDGLAFNLEAFGDGAVLGCDFAGKVEQVGSEVSRFAVGDDIAAFTWGGEISGVGAYSELCIANERLAYKVPSNISLEQAATIPLSATTAWLALFSSDCLQLSRDSPSTDPVLVLGGSSTVGSFTNQLASIYGIKTISTASKRNAEAVTKDGAEAVFDYNESDVTKQIKNKYPNIDTIFDTIGNPSSTASAAEVLGSRQSALCTVRPGKTHTEDIPDHVKVSDVFVFTVFPKEHSYRGRAFWPINHGNIELGAQFYEHLPEFISAGKLKPRPVKSLGKLSAESVLEAIELTSSGKVSNAKLCFSVS